jgi:hypothetical protein
MLIYLESKYNACFKIENRVEKPVKSGRYIYNNFSIIYSIELPSASAL